MYTIDTSLGRIGVSLAADGGIGGLRFLVDSRDPAEAGGREPGSNEGPLPDVVRELARQIDQYAAGERGAFDLPVSPPLGGGIGTEFERAVWAAACRIPAGQTRTYGQLASEIGRPNAARAVGAALGRNPVALLIPCHRVVGRGGTLTGYAFGLQMKRRLLAIESPGASLLA